MCRILEPVAYEGSNMSFLDQVIDRLREKNIRGNYLFRATEEEHLGKVLEHGTDRAGFPGRKVWRYSTGDNVIYHEDVIIGATREALKENEINPTLPTLFKNFVIYDRPVLLVYEKSFFRHLRDNHYMFIPKQDRRRTLLAVIPVIPTLQQPGYQLKETKMQPKPDTDSLNLIVENEGELNLSVFVGNDDAMNNVNFVLVENEINGILNCAAELRFDNETCSEYFKVGFWDGYGNNTTTLASAIYTLDQLLSKRHWPWVGYTPRNVLVNCHSGHSRSVTVMATYLCQKHPDQYSWESALALVMEKRKWPNPPTSGMQELARLLIEQIHEVHGENATLFTILNPKESSEK